VYRFHTLISESLGPLSKRVKEPQVQDIVDTLCTHLLNDKKGADELRDISSIGLKTVIAEIPLDPPALSSLLIKRLTPKLIQGISISVSLLKILSQQIFTIH
jgi:cullin-associated NEDD8-dissociated protein 1